MNNRDDEEATMAHAPAAVEVDCDFDAKYTRENTDSAVKPLSDEDLWRLRAAYKYTLLPLIQPSQVERHPPDLVKFVERLGQRLGWALPGR